MFGTARLASRPQTPFFLPSRPYSFSRRIAACRPFLSPVPSSHSTLKPCPSSTPQASFCQASRRRNAARRARCEFAATPTFHAQQTLPCRWTRERRSVIQSRCLCKGNSSALPRAHQSIFSQDDTVAVTSQRTDSSTCALWQSDPTVPGPALEIASSQPRHPYHLATHQQVEHCFN